MSRANSAQRETGKRRNGEETEKQDDILADFEANALRPLKERIDNSFIHTYKPVMDDVPFRSFDTMKEYRDWCGKHLPKWLGYGKTL